MAIYTHLDIRTIKYNNVEIPLVGGSVAEPYAEDTYDSTGNLLTCVMHGFTIVRNYYCNGQSYLTSIFIPNTVTKIGSNAFSSCTRLELSNLPPYLESIGSSAFSSCSKLGPIITIPASCTAVDANAFGNCTSLTTVYIANPNPNSFTWFGGSINSAFSGCTNLRDIYVPWASSSSGGISSSAPWGAPNASMHYNWSPT